MMFLLLVSRITKTHTNRYSGCITSSQRKQKFISKFTPPITIIKIHSYCAFIIYLFYPLYPPSLRNGKIFHFFLFTLKTFTQFSFSKYIKHKQTASIAASPPPLSLSFVDLNLIFFVLFCSSLTCACQDFFS